MCRRLLSIAHLSRTTDDKCPYSYLKNLSEKYDRICQTCVYFRQFKFAKIQYVKCVHTKILCSQWEVIAFGVLVTQFILSFLPLFNAFICRFVMLSLLVHFTISPHYKFLSFQLCFWCCIPQFLCGQVQTSISLS